MPRKEVFTPLADVFNIELVDCSTDFVLPFPLLEYIFEAHTKPNHYLIVDLNGEKKTFLRHLLYNINGVIGKNQCFGSVSF